MLKENPKIGKFYKFKPPSFYDHHDQDFIIFTLYSYKVPKQSKKFVCLSIVRTGLHEMEDDIVEISEKHLKDNYIELC